MNAYAIFTTKRGRPKTDQSIICPIKIHAEAKDILSDLLCLQQITKTQFENGQFYTNLYNKYLKSIDAPVNSNSSMISINNKFCRTRRMFSEAEDLSVATRWSLIKSELIKIHPKCEEIIYRVVIENKDKDALLNPRSIAENQLAILRKGLDKIGDCK